MFAFCRPTLEGNSFFARPASSSIPSTWILTFSCCRPAIEMLPAVETLTTVRCFFFLLVPLLLQRTEPIRPLCRCGCSGKGTNAIQRHLVQWSAPPRAGRQCLFHSKGHPEMRRVRDDPPLFCSECYCADVEGSLMCSICGRGSAQYGVN
ncbi:hypothetical protein TRIATDRAFT_302979 [Trichoderma atroviride IMI 206040]|uniref:Uncharacterized protein n=1 Tax=Hypocrea atroviridis (strain ATCC 20476 / IMI 206040) TaxID=452589 RepID=G9PBB0_HYPAI|nr:uncharacterized protein TRIATDRAFT_302979 [Trichoderma atroviride IMI 206040]EHK39658.1 hypothetical protein TRIATDRAFT_302979 [Trichoderma atroviride IMI 206040]